MSAVINWNSPDVPYYLDAETVCDTAFYIWDEYCPRKTGNMASHSDYEVHGKHMYVWNDCVYAGYQDYETKYAGWFHEELPRTFERVLSDFDRQSKNEQAPLPSWMERIINEAVNNED